MRIGIIGAGPAGTVCALSLLAASEKARFYTDVTIFDGKSFLKVGPRGCNMCAGVIPAYLVKVLEELGAKVPERLIQSVINGHYFETLAGGVHIPKDPNATICTVFRSVGPLGDPPAIERSFDHFLLRSAQDAGAAFIPSNIREITMPGDPMAPFGLRTADGRNYKADVLIGAFGVNTELTGRFETLGFGYRAPRTIRVCQAELPIDPDFIDSAYRGEIKIISLALPGIRFGALTPKRRHITVSLIGEDLTRSDLERFLSHPRVIRHFPPGWRIPDSYCYCHPRLPVSAARNPLADRLIIVGDANVSRYLKGGIESAFFTGSLAAKMVIEGRLSREELQKGFLRPCHQKYLHDNIYGKLLFGFNDLISRWPQVALAGLWLVRREHRFSSWEKRRQSRILWHIFTGDAPYRWILKDALGLKTSSSMILALMLSLLGLIKKEGLDDNSRQ